MRLEKGLRAAMMKPYPLGHDVVPTDGVNKEDPKCFFGGVKDGGIWLTEPHFPMLIGLQVRVIPIWVEDEEATAKLAENKACALYPTHAVFSHVRLEVTGSGQYQKTAKDEWIHFKGEHFLEYRLDMPKGPLYQKAFLTQTEGKAIYWDSSEENEQRIIPLWAYGAQQIEGDIHPLVFTLESTKVETLVRASSLMAWREQGISPFHEVEKESSTKVVFQDVFEGDQARTLLESVEAGMATLDLEIGVDEKGAPIKIHYVSYRLSNGCLFYKKGG